MLQGPPATQALLVGGVDEQEAAYQEAVKAIFDKQVACHRHQRYYTSRKTGKKKWTILEMWRLAVCEHRPLIPSVCFILKHMPFNLGILQCGRQPALQGMGMRMSSRDGCSGL